MSKGYVIEYKDEYGSGTGYSFKKFNTRYEALDFINELRQDPEFSESWSEYTLYDLSNKDELEEFKEAKFQDDTVHQQILNSLY
jgi:hypothetical protein